MTYTNLSVYITKKTAAVLLGVMLGLCVTLATNAQSQWAVGPITLPTDFTVTLIVKQSSDPLAHDAIITVPHTGTSQQHITGTTNTTHTGDLTVTGTILSGQAQEELAVTYARRIEMLIMIKGQETRMNMLHTMDIFLKKYDPQHPLYHTIARMVDIIKLGEVANKLEYCTQFDDSYSIGLFGFTSKIHSTIKYNPTIKKCEITYEYSDGSVHTCQLNDAQKEQLSILMRDKQGIAQAVAKELFEEALDKHLDSGVCFESQEATLKEQPSMTTIIQTGAAPTKGGLGGWWNKIVNK